MQEVIISDTSCIILLNKIGAIDILQKLFGEITITQVIAEEYKRSLPNWFKIEDPKEPGYLRLLSINLDPGEASAIALAIEQTDSLLIMDDLKGRRYAERLGIKVTGTLGVIVEAKLSGHIEAVKPFISKIKQTNFRLTSELEAKVLEKAMEG